MLTAPRGDIHGKGTETCPGPPASLKGGESVVHAGGTRSFSGALNPKRPSVATCIAALGLRHRPRPGGPSHGTPYPHHRVGMGQASEASQVISPLVSRTLKQEKEARKLFPSVFENNPSCSHLAEWGLSDLLGVGTFLVSLRGSASVSTFTPPPGPVSTPLCLCPPQSTQPPSHHRHQGGQMASFRDTLPDLSL